MWKYWGKVFVSEGKPTGATCGDEGSIVRGGWVLVVVEVDGGRWSVAGLPGCFLEDRYPLIGPAHGRCESSRNCEETGQFACAFPQSFLLSPPPPPPLLLWRLLRLFLLTQCPKMQAGLSPFRTRTLARRQRPSHPPWVDGEVHRGPCMAALLVSRTTSDVSRTASQRWRCFDSVRCKHNATSTERVEGRVVVVAGKLN